MGRRAAFRLGALAFCLVAVGATLAHARFSDPATSTSNAFTTDTLSPPTTLGASVAGSTVNLSWTATSDTYAAGHRVLRGTASGGPYTQIAQVTPRTTTTYADSPGTGTFYYVVHAYFQNWESVNSNEVSASVQIAFVAASQASAPSGTTTLTVSTPSGTSQNNVMIAAIAVRPQTATITAPSGWTLVRRTDNANANANSLAVYRKVAGASEPSSYTWSFSSSTGSAGGIMTFTNVNTSTPVNVENGQNTPNDLSHATPSVTTTVANTMLVTSHAFTSSATWTPPSGMTEGVDVASLTVPNAAGIALEMNYVLRAAVGSTGTKTATASNDADVGNAHILALGP